MIKIWFSAQHSYTDYRHAEMYHLLHLVKLGVDILSL